MESQTIKIMIGAFILSIGQETESEAIASINKQVDAYEIIRNIKPVNHAENICFQKAKDNKYDYFIFLGADTIMYPNAISIMMGYMKPKNWCVMGRLQDYWRGDQNYGNHLYNLKALQGYRHDENDLLYDHKIHWDMEKLGFTKAITKELVGKHHPIWTVQEAFEKYFFNAKRYDESQLKWLLESAQIRHAENPNDVTRAALEGYALGIKHRDNKEVFSFETTKEWEENKYNFDINQRIIW